MSTYNHKICLSTHWWQGCVYHKWSFLLKNSFHHFCWTYGSFLPVGKAPLRIFYGGYLKHSLVWCRRWCWIFLETGGSKAVVILFIVFICTYITPHTHSKDCLLTHKLQISCFSYTWQGPILWGKQIYLFMITKRERLTNYRPWKCQLCLISSIANVKNGKMKNILGCKQSGILMSFFWKEHSTEARSTLTSSHCFSAFYGFIKSFALSYTLPNTAVCCIQPTGILLKESDW